MPKTIVLCCAALSPELLKEAEGLPHLGPYLKKAARLDVVPVFPAVTCSAQVSYVTGAPIWRHGVVGNGWYDRRRDKVEFWQHSSRLLGAPPLWQAAKEANPEFRAAALFWWHCKYSGLDFYMNVEPIHLEKGGMLSSCYSHPTPMYPDIAKELGEFPLPRYWGPLAGIESTRWIVGATERVFLKARPSLLLTYLPELDYVLQKSGPEGAEAKRALAALDAEIAPLLRFGDMADVEVILLSEYSIRPVKRALFPNRLLREHGMVSVRTVGGMEYLDMGGSQAFAVADHQVAHIYTQDGIVKRKVKYLLGSLDGIQTILDREQKSKFGLNHPHAGDLTLVAETDTWFAYPWWFLPEKAPDFAKAVDIHRKPGYDPLELFWDPANQCIQQNPELVKGSHGLHPSHGGGKAVFCTNHPTSDLPPGEMKPADVADYLKRACGVEPAAEAPPPPPPA